MSADLSALPLQWSLYHIPSSPPILRAHLKNTSPTPYTILRWSTPLDPSALNLQGVFKFTNADNTEVPRPQIAASRKMPPPSDSYIEIPARGEVTQDFELNASWLPQKFRVSAHGRWSAVWPSIINAISQEAKDAAVGTGAGEYNAAEIEVDLTGSGHGEVKH